jgi:hypothetical protein
MQENHERDEIGENREALEEEMVVEFGRFGRLPLWLPGLRDQVIPESGGAWQSHPVGRRRRPN